MQGVLDEFRWIPTHLQLADSLTKVMDADTLIKTLETGVIRLRPTATELEGKKGTMKLHFVHKLPADQVTRGRPKAMQAMLRVIVPNQCPTF